MVEAGTMRCTYICGRCDREWLDEYGYRRWAPGSDTSFTAYYRNGQPAALRLADVPCPGCGRPTGQLVFHSMLSGA